MSNNRRQQTFVHPTAGLASHPRIIGIPRKTLDTPKSPRVSLTGALFDVFLPGTSIDQLAYEKAFSTYPSITKPLRRQDPVLRFTGARPLSAWTGYDEPVVFKPRRPSPGSLPPVISPLPTGPPQHPGPLHVSPDFAISTTTLVPSPRAPASVRTSSTSSKTTMSAVAEGKQTKKQEIFIPIDTPINDIPYYSKRTVVQHSTGPVFAAPPQAHWPQAVKPADYPPWYSSSYHGYSAHAQIPPSPPLPPAASKTAKETKNTKQDEVKVEASKAKKTEKKKTEEVNVVKEIKEMKQASLITLLMHVCVTCKKPRSSGYHRDHPLIPGQRSQSTECGKCIKDRKKKAEIHYTDEDTETEAKQKKKFKKEIQNTDAKAGEKIIALPELKKGEPKASGSAEKRSEAKAKEVDKSTKQKVEAGEKQKDDTKSDADKIKIVKLRRTIFIIDGDSDREHASATIEHRHRQKARQPSMESDVESTRIIIRPERNRGHKSTRQDGLRHEAHRSRVPEPHGYLKSYAHPDSAFTSSFVGHFTETSTTSKDIDHRMSSKAPHHRKTESLASSRDTGVHDLASQSSQSKASVKKIEYDQSTASKLRSRLQSSPYMPPPSPLLSARKDSEHGDKYSDKVSIKKFESRAPKKSDPKDATSIPGVRYVEPRDKAGSVKQIQKLNGPPSASATSKPADLQHTCGRAQAAAQKSSSRAQSEISGATSRTTVYSDKTTYPAKESDSESDWATETSVYQSSRREVQSKADQKPDSLTSEAIPIRAASSTSASEASRDSPSSHHRRHRRTRYRYSRHTGPHDYSSDTESAHIRLPPAERVLSYRQYHRETSEDQVTPPASAVGRSSRRPSPPRRPPTFTRASNDSLGPRGYQYGYEPVAHMEPVSAEDAKTSNVNESVLRDYKRKGRRDRHAIKWRTPSDYESPRSTLSSDTEGSVWERDLNMIWENTKDDFCTMSGALT